MGKTTTVNAIMGLLPAAPAAVVEFRGQTGSTACPPFPHSPASASGLVPEGRQIFPNSRGCAKTF